MVLGGVAVEMAALAGTWETWELMPDTIEPWKTELTEWFESQERLKNAPPPKQEELEIFRIDPAETELRRKREADEKAGLARLQQYVTERGLLENDQNLQALRKFMDEHPQIKGIITPGTIDATISHLGPKGQNVLRWAQPKPATSPQPVPAVEYLPNGEVRLPLDSSEAVMRRASVTQLRDLSARRQEGKRTWRDRWHAASLK